MATETILPVLYTFRRCPYAIRARMALRYAGIDVQFREVALRDKPAALLAISAKATVPVLQLANGQVIDQSLDIMRWALHHSDPDGWLAAGDPMQAEQWIALNDGPFKDLLDQYKYAGRDGGPSSVAHRERALEALIRPLHHRLAAQPFLFGSRTSMADVAIFPFVRQFAMVDKAWFDALPLPGVHAWLNSCLSCKLFEQAMAKAPVLMTGPKFA